MSASSLPADIANMIKQLEGVDHASSTVVDAARFIVATDWSEAAVPLTVLRAFRAIVPPGSGAQLVFAVPGEPAPHDAACVKALLQGAGTPDDLRGLELASFEDAAAQAYDCAVVPTGDTADVIQQVGGVITRMHDVVRGGEHGIETRSNIGDGPTLRLRLSSFCA